LQQSASNIRTSVHRQQVPNPFQSRKSAPSTREERGKSAKEPQPLPHEDDSQTIFPQPPLQQHPKASTEHRSSFKPQHIPSKLVLPKEGRQKGNEHVPEDDSQTIIPPPAATRQVAVGPADQTLAPHSKRKREVDPNALSDPQSSSSKSSKKSSRGSSSTSPKSTLGSGWMSSRPAKDFVAEVAARTPSTNRRPTSHLASSSVPSNQQRGTPRENIPASYPKPPPQKNTNTEEPYCEVVRNKAERQKLKAFDCAECGKFIDAIMEDDLEGVYNRHELMCASRHRHQFTPPDTPEDFWELSFADSIARRRNQPEDTGKQSGMDDDDGLD
jgi:hypothetical protein